MRIVQHKHNVTTAFLTLTITAIINVTVNHRVLHLSELNFQTSLNNTKLLLMTGR
jgi:hypothetical protein